MSNKTNRVEWIDNARGLAVLFLIFGHLDIGVAEKWIYSFHVPLFFFLSGLVFNDKNNISQVLTKRTKTLLVPYFTLGIPLTLFYALYSSLNGDQIIIIDIIYSFFVQKRFLTIWFLPSLFFLNLFFSIMIKFTNKYPTIIVISFMLVIVGLAYYRYVDWRAIWNLDVSFMAAPFFSIGYILNKEKIKIESFLLKKRNLIFSTVLFLLVNVVCCIVSIKITGDTLSMYSSVYGNICLSYLSAFSGILFVCCLARLIKSKRIKEIGEYSIVYCAWHQTIMLAICNCLFELFNINAFVTTGILFWLGVVVKCQLICILTKLVIHFVKKTNLVILIGK